VSWICWSQVCKLGFIIPRCFDFLICHCIVLLLTNYNIKKLNSFTTNMGYLWNYYESFIAHCEELCFELELKALAPWGCLPFCHIYMLPTSWKTFPPKDSYSLAEEEANVFNFELDKLNLHMKHQVLKVLLSFLSFFILLIKKVYIYINFDVGSQV
jgi:hypothetical protein